MLQGPQEPRWGTRLAEPRGFHAPEGQTPARPPRSTGYALSLGDEICALTAHAGGSDTTLRGGELALGEAVGGPGPGWRSRSSELRNQHVDKPAYATVFRRVILQDSWSVLLMNCT